jgi:protein-tyrosine phosphatase
MKPAQRRRSKRPNLTNLMPVISSCSMSYASMSVTPTKFLPEEPGRTLTAVDFVQKTIMPIGLNNNNVRTFQQKIRKQPGTVIIPQKLYLTSITEAQSLNYLKKNKITAILTISTEPVEIPEELQKSGIKTKFVHLGDNCTSHIKSYFDEMNEFIDNNERVVVHCHAGISRSATAVIAYIMKTLRMTLNEAKKFVQARRHFVCPNLSFMVQMRSYQDDLQKKQLE